MAHRNDEKFRALDAQTGHINDRYAAVIGGTGEHISSKRRNTEYADTGQINDAALAFYGGTNRPDGESAYWAAQP
jgi:hypothetical protein